MTRLKETGREAICVTRTAAPMITPIIGVLTREDIEKYYGLQRLTLHHAAALAESLPHCIHGLLVRGNLSTYRDCSCITP